MVQIYQLEHGRHEIIYLKVPANLRLKIAFRLLRQPIRPNTPSAVAKRGSAAGSGVGASTSQLPSSGEAKVTPNSNG
jgi:hypothetical protein